MTMIERSSLYPEYYGLHYQKNAPDYSRCCESVRQADSRWPRYHQCVRKRGHGPDGAYCKQHDPEAVKARDEASRKRSDEQYQNRRYEWHGRSFFDVLVKIAEGHNDARGLAQEAIDKFRKG